MSFINNQNYSYLDVKSQLYNMIKEGFKELANDNYKVSVFRRDPIIDTGSEGAQKELPAVTIHRVRDTESDQFTGEVIDIGESGNPIMGRFFNEVFELKIWANLAGLRDDIYVDLKKILMLGKKDFLENEGVMTIRFSDGGDGSDHKQLPGGKPLFWATVELDLVNPFMFESQAPIETIQSIEEELSIFETDPFL